jgi:hypothetical protein
MDESTRPEVGRVPVITRLARPRSWMDAESPEVFGGFDPAPADPLGLLVSRVHPGTRPHSGGLRRLEVRRDPESA